MGNQDLIKLFKYVHSPYACVLACLCVHAERQACVVRLHIPAAQQNSVLLRHTESVNNRLNHKGHPLLYFSSSASTCSGDTLGTARLSIHTHKNVCIFSYGRLCD